MKIEELIVVLGFDVDDKGVKRFLTGLDKAKSAAKGVVRGIKNIVLGAGAAAAALGGIGLAIGRSVFQTGEKFEQLQISLNALEGSSERGREAMEWIKDFAKRTPLELDEVVRGFRQMRVFGMDPTNGSFQSLMDTMAATGGNSAQLQRIILALGQAWTKQKLQGDDALQLLEAGVPVWDMLSQVMGKNVKEIQDLSSKGKIGRKELQLLIDALGKKYAGAADDMANTSVGIKSNISDIIEQFKLMVAEAGFFDSVKDRLKGVLETFKGLETTGKLEQFAKRISDVLVAGMDRFLSLIDSISLDDVVNGMRSVIDMAFSMISILGGVVTVFDRIATGIQAYGGFFGIDLRKGQAILIVIAAIAAALAPVPVAIAAAVLALDDFINWMQGGDSVIGSLMEKWTGFWHGLGVSIRETFAGAWEAFKTAFWDRMAAEGEALRAGMASIPQGLVDGFTAVFGWIRDQWDALIGWMSEKLSFITGVVDRVSGFFGGTGEGPQGPTTAGNGPTVDRSNQGRRAPANQNLASPTVQRSGRRAPSTAQQNIANAQLAANSQQAAAAVTTNSNNNTQNTANVNVTNNITEAQAAARTAEQIKRAATDASFQSAGTTVPEAAY